MVLVVFDFPPVLKDRYFPEPDEDIRDYRVELELQDDNLDIESIEIVDKSGRVLWNSVAYPKEDLRKIAIELMASFIRSL